MKPLHPVSYTQKSTTAVRNVSQTTTKHCLPGLILSRKFHLVGCYILLAEGRREKEARRIAAKQRTEIGS